MAVVVGARAIAAIAAAMADVARVLLDFEGWQGDDLLRAAMWHRAAGSCCEVV